MIFKFIKPKTAVVCSLFAALIVILSLFYARGLKDKEFNRFKESAGKLLRKTGALAEKARQFKQVKALNSLKKAPFNGFYYRFDDHIAQAQVEGELTKKTGTPYLVNFEFAGNDTIIFQSEKETYSIATGILKIKHVPGAYFKAVVNLPYNQVGGIEIRAKHRKGKLMRLGLGRNMARQPSGKRFTDYFCVIPDNKFHKYAIDVKQLLKRKIAGRENLKDFYLFASEIDRDDVKIDYIRILSKKANYLHKPFGSGCETKKGETRKVLFSQTQLSFTYHVKIPRGESYLRFGIGIIDNENPVTFKILAGNKQEIFSREMKSAAEWQNARINMKPYAGKKINITFKTESRKKNIAFWSNPILYKPPQERFNIIIVLEDTLRADHMSCYGYKRDTTPVKKKFAGEGVLFLNSFAQAPKTRPSCISLMTSLYPTATKVYLLENYLTLAEILRYTGFRTASFIQNAHAGAFVGLHQGFSYLSYKYSKTAKTRDIYGKEVIEWIKEHDDMNYFLYVHVVDPHAPYNPPEKFRHLYNDASSGKKDVPVNRQLDPPWVTAPTMQGRRARYDGEIRNNDFYFGKFLSGLKEIGSLDNTLIIFIADHGEHLGEHDLWSHIPPCYVQVIKTPMIMVCPKKLPRGRVVTQPVQNLDIVPTILDLLKINRDNLLLAGDSLLPLIAREEPDFWNNRIILSNEMPNITNNVKQGQYASLIFKDKHILNDNTISMRQFNYLQDKDELKGTSLSGKQKEFHTSFIRNLFKNNVLIWQAITKKKSHRAKYDQATLKHLRSLGYVE
jgi:arylsulfatase